MYERSKKRKAFILNFVGRNKWRFSLVQVHLKENAWSGCSISAIWKWKKSNDDYCRRWPKSCTKSSAHDDASCDGCQLLVATQRIEHTYQPSCDHREVNKHKIYVDYYFLLESDWLPKFSDWVWGPLGDIAKTRSAGVSAFSDASWLLFCRRNVFTSSVWIYLNLPPRWNNKNWIYWLLVISNVVLLLVFGSWIT